MDFARDLLSRGIQGRQGIGDVQVRPSPGPAGGEPGGVLNTDIDAELNDLLRRAS